MMSLTDTPAPNAPFKHHAHAFLLALPQRLRREDAFAFTCADAEGDGAKGAVGTGVAVAADQSGARQRKAEFRPDDMDDAVPTVVHGDVRDRRTAGRYPSDARLAERQDHPLAALLRNRVGTAWSATAICASGRRTGAVLCNQAGKSLRAGDLLDQMPIDVDQRVTVIVGFDNVLSPNLIVKRKPAHGMRSFSSEVPSRHASRSRRHTSIVRSKFALARLLEANYASLHAYSIRVAACSVWGVR